MEMGVGDAIISLPQGRTILVCAVKGGWKGGCLASNEFIPNQPHLKFKIFAKMSVVLAQTTGKWKDEKYTVRTKGYLKCWQAAFKKC